MYKLIISNFDNTLINSEEAISSSTMIKLEEVRNRGILFGISTNRCYKEVLAYNKDFPFIDYIISYNGAYVYDVKKDKTLLKKHLLINSIKKIYNNFSNYDLLFYTEDYNYNIKEIDVDFFKDNKIYKISILCNDSYDFIIDKINSLNLDISIYKYYKDGNIYLDIFRDSINKLVGLNSICKKINLDEVIGVGYDYSDLELLENVGYSVLVSNGCDKLKNKVDFITNSNDCNGILKLLEKMF